MPRKPQSLQIDIPSIEGIHTVVLRRLILLRLAYSAEVATLATKAGSDGVFGEENKNRITFDSDWICFITAKKLQ
jgi:hypothetical protein